MDSWIEHANAGLELENARFFPKTSDAMLLVQERGTKDGAVSTSGRDVCPAVFSFHAVWTLPASLWKPSEMWFHVVRKLNIHTDISQSTMSFYQQHLFLGRPATGYREITAKGSQSFRHEPTWVLILVVPCVSSTGATRVCRLPPRGLTCNCHVAADNHDKLHHGRSLVIAV